MLKRFLAVTMFLTFVGWVQAQDMPPLPAMPGSDQAAAAPSGGSAPPMPALPNSNPSTSTPAASGPALPPLPDTSASSSTSGGPVLPPLPGSAAPAASPSTPASSGPALPPLPDQGSAPVPPQNAAPSTSAPSLPPLPGSSSTTTAPALPPLPGSAATETTQPPETKALPAATEGVTGTGEEPKKKGPPRSAWPVPPAQPNVIFGGWVKGKGSNPTARIAWASQEVLNALIFKGYKNLADQEKGNYQGQPGDQWRSLFFKAPKTKVTVQVYVKPEGKRVWVRVGPDEPPAGEKMAKVVQLKNEDWKALQILRHHLKGRLLPHEIRVVRDWTAPFHRPQETADE